MTLEALKQEVQAASPEVREALFYYLVVLRRDSARMRELAARLDDPTRWISEDEAARRLGLDAENGE